MGSVFQLSVCARYIVVEVVVTVKQVSDFVL